MRRSLFLLGVLLITACADPSPLDPSAATTGAPAEENSVPSSEASTSPTDSPADTATYKEFRLASGNIGCGWDIEGPGTLRCDINSGMRPEPKGKCTETPWAGIVIGKTGKPYPLCAGDAAFDQGAPVLGDGETWTRAGITCKARDSSLECTNASGPGFTLAREGWSIH